VDKEQNHKMNWYKRNLRPLSSVALFAYLIAYGPIDFAKAAELTTIPSGTQVMLRPSETITPKAYKSGDAIDFIVVQDVKIKDTVAIKGGARARAIVTESKKAGVLGMPAKLAVEHQTVEAVDGTLIPVIATKSTEGDDKIVLTVVLTLICLPLILLRGGDTQISPATTFDAFTIGSAELKTQ
jgi:hypothetical protein